MTYGLIQTGAPWAGSGGQTVWTPTVARPGAPLVIFSHGALGTSNQVFDSEICRWLVQDGYTVLGHDLGGVTHWATPRR